MTPPTASRSPGRARAAAVPDQLWVRRSLLTAAGGMVVGLGMLLVGVLGARGDDRLTDQLVWINLAMVGTAVAAVAQGSVLLGGRRALGAARRSAVSAADRRFAGITSERPSPLADRPAPSGAVVTVDGGTRLHRSDCLFVRGKPVHAADLDADLDADLPRCEVCRP
jgi:hypothetical protein